MRLKISTKTGDDGTTSLLGGERVSKNDPLIRTVGELDELNAVLGTAKVELAFADPQSEDTKLLARVQMELFSFGAELMRPTDDATLWDNSVQFLETRIAELESRLPPLVAFVLPGQNRASAQLHVARTVCRRVERSLVGLLETQVEPRLFLVTYLNRLSDLLFLLARAY